MAVCLDEKGTGMDIPDEFMPSDHQKRMWSSFTDPSSDPDGDGNWLGWCPIHDRLHADDVPSAHYNFKRGVMRCLNDPPCHEGKRAISLSNLIILMSHKEAVRP